MASSEAVSYETALCILPPSHLTHDFERLRELYDKAYGRWPPHLNLIYPFVAPENLPRVLDLVQSTLASKKIEFFPLCLGKPGFFDHKRSSTVYTTDGEKERCDVLDQLRREILGELGHSSNSHQLHLTIGQTEAEDSLLRDYLLAKVALLPQVEWEVTELVVLIRDRSQGLDTSSSPMRVWATLPLSGQEPWVNNLPTTGTEKALTTLSSPTVQSRPTFRFVEGKGTWEASLSPSPGTALEEQGSHVDSSLVTLSSYNVLVDAMHPPSLDRYPLLLQNLLSDTAAADILLLQEVSDDFLSYLLKDAEIRRRYPFATHGPPDQADMAPLPSLRNTVVLSRWSFSWEWLPFEKRHKGAVIVKFDYVGTLRNSTFLPLVVAGVHLSCGLIDSSIAAKKSQLRAILRHLADIFRDNSCFLAGDFNITTSSYTLDLALKRKSITAEGASNLSGTEVLLSQEGFYDCYYVSRAAVSSEMSDCSHARQEYQKLGTLYEGEEGATYDPTHNHLATQIAGKSFHSRPQRYDRILVKGDRSNVLRFNMFGFPVGDAGVASDHWGIRAVLTLDSQSAEPERKIPLIEAARAPKGLGDVNRLKECLHARQMFPSPEEMSQRTEAIELVTNVINHQEDSPAAPRLNISFVVVPVGSYWLGVWDAASDLDLLVIGQISPRVFFALTTPKLRRAADHGIKILRKVRAASGTMLELEVCGVQLDLQYCAATRIVESWPQALELPPTDSIFDLPMQSLIKLNALRDTHYLERTIPDLAAFRLAYRSIKTWAQQRGLYSAKLGYLGGVHIVSLLARICKLAFRTVGLTSAADIICTFFQQYAQFNWKKDVVYDPTFYQNGSRYMRSFREPLVILSLHAPRVNVARAASVPSARTLEQEFARANRLLSSPGASWKGLIDSTAYVSGVDEFQKSYASYVKVDVQYWGGAATKGRALIGWLEWRCVSLLVDIHRKFPDILARIWPARFTQIHENEDSDKEYQGCYLIGLAKGDVSTTSTGPMTEPDKQSAQISLLAILRTFAEEIRADEKYFDASSCWVDVTLAKGSEVGDLRIDDRHWGSYGGEDDEEEEEEEEEEDQFHDDGGDDDESHESLPVPKRGSLPSRKSVGGGPKLRPAGEILSRLRWDPNLDTADYIVGYEDRFLGEQEMGVDQWKAELTDEAFIPMHRILYFKRKADGVRVWDRETRTDLLSKQAEQEGTCMFQMR
ncbi:hypothetical protein ASPZODRAFT_54896 [Penicilliopsis zonata CBS 506.65]|uniref:polynucleotide adenylyltransferase n=1 Tax=Penicilliopsis zonata CBS 506.65 TaxID=1073090 RepID=A0A1L9SUC8_9EURO|nr:hypothetical protein ASPZODRAFT_54896 [Penicilliopsis zonata CBS 506.65]OJJ50673.1 hypothetical protein ASPZODRAFT_54896 [Penicilliopsis zonata CBS 506.65]